MNHVRRRLSLSSNNVSNMRLEGVIGIPLQVQVQETNPEHYPPAKGDVLRPVEGQFYPGADPVVGRAELSPGVPGVQLAH